MCVADRGESPRLHDETIRCYSSAEPDCGCQCLRPVMSWGIGVAARTARLFRGIAACVAVALSGSCLLATSAEHSRITEDQYAVWSTFLNSELSENFHDWGQAGVLSSFRATRSVTL